MGPVLLAGEAVDQVGDVLPPQDLLGGQVRGGRADLPVDDGQRVLQARQLLAPAGDEGKVERAAGEPPGPADPLQVRGDRLGQRREQHRGQVADVDAHLQRGRGDEHVRRVRVAGRVLELALVPQPGGVVDQARVLPGDDPAHVGRRVQAAVVVVWPRLAVAAARDSARAGTGAPSSWATTVAVPGCCVRQTVQVSRLRPASSSAGSAGLTTTALAGMVNTVPPLSVGDRVQDVRAGQPLEQLPGQPRAVGGGDAERPRGPPRVPGPRAC